MVVDMLRSEAEPGVTLAIALAGAALVTLRLDEPREFLGIAGIGI
jgi:hypothetical protein